MAAGHGRLNYIKLLHDGAEPLKMLISLLTFPSVFFFLIFLHCRQQCFTLITLSCPGASSSFEIPRANNAGQFYVPFFSFMRSSVGRRRTSPLRNDQLDTELAAVSPPMTVPWRGSTALGTFYGRGWLSQITVGKIPFPFPAIRGTSSLCRQHLFKERKRKIDMGGTQSPMLGQYRQ